MAEASRDAPGFLSLRTLLEASVAGVLSLAGALIVFGPLLGSLNQPLSGGDLFTSYVTTSYLNPLSVVVTTHVGFPAGMDLRYFPGLDIVQSSIAQLINAATGSDFLGVNLVLLLSYPVVGACAYLTIRLTRLRGPLAIALATAYALIPFHWDRGLGHVYLATLYSATLGVALALLIGSGQLPAIVAAGRLRGLRIGLLVALVVLVAWSGVYFAFFTLLLTGAAWLWRVAHRDDRRALAWAAAPILAIGVLIVVGLLPSVVQGRSHPPALPISDRLPSESITYAGNLLMATLPAPISDFPGLASYNAWASALFASMPANEASGIGNFGTWVTSACLVVFLIGGVLLRRIGIPGLSWTLVAYLIVVTVTFFIPSGLNALFANTVTTQIRAWNRLLPILLLLFVVGACLVLAQLRWKSSPPLTVPIALVILAATVSGSVLPYRALYQGTARNAADLANQALDYAAQVNAAIPERCGILQLPYVPYPEAGPTSPALADYEHFVTALLNPDKDFSYGSVKHTEASTLAAGISTPITPGDINRLRAAGFCAIHLDLRGYEPGPLAETQVMLHAFLGDPIANGRDGAWLTYAIGPQAN